MPKHKHEVIWFKLGEKLDWKLDLLSLRKFTALTMLYNTNESERDDVIAHYFYNSSPNASSFYNHLNTGREKMKIILTVLEENGWLLNFMNGSGYHTEGEILIAMGYDIKDLYASDN